MARLGDVIARLSVNLSLETAAFEKGATKSEKRFNQMKREFSDVSKKFAIGAAAIGAAVGAVTSTFRSMGQQAIASAREIEQLSQVANASTDEFQKASFAARSVGIESEKLADIYKDVNDKIGDFVATGGGAMADFFENIGPKVGVTAESFRELSGPQALQLYVSSLEKANLNQQELTFYMEALSSDATALLPLLQNNGKAMGEFAADAERLGLVLSSEEIAKAQEVAHNLGLLNAQIEAQQNKKMLENAETILKFEEGLGELKLAAIQAVVGLQELGEGMDNAVIVSNRALHDFADAINSRLSQGHHAIKNFATNAVAYMQRMYQGVKTWLQDKLSAVFDWVQDKVKRVERAFYWLADQTVFNSHIPDMVDEIGAHMARLQHVMVDPAIDATSRTNEAFRSMASNVGSLLDRLFPKIARLNQMRDELALLDQAAKSGAITEDIAAQARVRARADARGDLGNGGRPEPTAGTTGIAGPTIDYEDTYRHTMDELADRLGGKESGKLIPQVEQLRDAFAAVGGKWGEVAGSIAEAIAGVINPAIEGAISKTQHFNQALSGLTSLFQEIFGKKAGGIIGAIVQIGTAAARAFGGGGGIPGYATGTSSAARGLALVGERGPELVRFRGGERVYNNASSRAMMNGRRSEMHFDLRGAVMTQDLVDQMNRIGQAAASEGARNGADLAHARARRHAHRRIA